MIRLIILSLSLSLFVGVPIAAADATARPNFLLLFADDLGYEKLGCYGGQDVPTPAIDAFAKGAVKFSRAYTSPVCTPSRMSLYTGRYTVNHRFFNVLPVHKGTEKAVDFSSLPTLPQRLRANGYVTSVTGKWQLATLEHHPRHIDSAGFDSWCIWQIWRAGAKTTRYWDPCFNLDGKVRDDISDRYGPDVLADYVIDRMKRAKEAGQPFYIHHNMLLPHWPILETPNEKASGEEPSLDRMITYLDSLAGRLVDAVDELGIADQTWVLFIGDNGTDSKKARQTSFGDVSGGKAILGDAGMHVPLIIRGPGQKGAGMTIDDLVDMADIFPTLCELAGVTIPEAIVSQIDGVSFAPSLLGQKGGAPARSFVTGGYGGDDCVFDGEWRLHRKGDGPLYDCRNLPAEPRADLNDPEAQAARKRLSRMLAEIQRKRP